MSAYDLNLRDYWRIIRRRKLVVIAVPLLFGLFGFAMSVLLVPAALYRATALVRFERALNVTGILLKDVISYSPVGDLETQAALIRSFPVMYRAAIKLDLLPRRATPAEVRASQPLLDVVSRLQRDVAVTVVSRTSLIEISATAPSPDEAMRIANGVAEAFQEDNLATRTQQLVEARRFIEAQLAEVGARLQGSEEARRRFQERTRLLRLPEGAAAALGRLTTQEAQYEEARRQLDAAETELRLLRERPPGDRLLDAAADGADPALAKLRASLAELALERDTLLLTLRPTHPQVKGLEARIATVRQNLAERLGAHRRRLIEAQTAKVAVLRAEAERLRQAVDALGREQAALPAAALELARLEREVRLNERIFSLLKERLQEALIKEKEQGAEISIVKPAARPAAPINPPYAGPKAMVALLIGLVVGLILAFVVEALDTSIGAIDEVEALLGSSVLGVIPDLDARRGLAAEPAEAGAPGRDPREFAVLPTLFAPRSPVAEAFRGLRTNLLFSVLERQCKTLMVTSAAQREGKTTVGVNLAVTLAQLGKRTLLLEADLRNPSIHAAFGIAKEPGLSDVVLGSASLDEVTRGVVDLMLGKAGMERLLESPGMDNLFILPSGRVPPNPSEFLSSQGLGQVLAEARQRYDYVILDSAPILAVADSAVLGARVDGILIVIRAGHVPRAALRRAKVLLEAPKAHLLGVCLTGVRADVSPDYAEMAYHGYRYGPPATKAPRAPKPARARRRRRLLVRSVPLLLAALFAGLTGLRAWQGDRPAPVPAPPASAPRLAPAPAPTASAPPHAPALGRPSALPALAPRAFTVQVADPALRGTLHLEEFPTASDAHAWGQALVRAGLISAFVVAPVPAAGP